MFDMGTMTVEQEAKAGVYLRRSIEKLMTGMAIAFSAMLILVDNVLHSDFYYVMRIIAPEKVWALIIFATSIGRLAFLWINGFYPHSPIYRAGFSAMTLLLAWIPFTASFLWLWVAKGSIVPGVVLAPGLAAIETLCFFTLMALWGSRRDDSG